MFTQQQESYIAAKCIRFSTLSGESSICSPNLIHNDNGLGNTGFSIIHLQNPIYALLLSQILSSGIVKEGPCYNFT